MASAGNMSTQSEVLELTLALEALIYPALRIHQIFVRINSALTYLHFL